MTIHIAVATAVTFFLCGALQSMVGFAFALFALPALLSLGVPLPQSVALVTMGALSQMLLAVGHMRRFVLWRELAPLMAVAMLTTPIGILLMHQLSGQAGVRIRQVVGGIILVTVMGQWLLHPAPREHVAVGWGYLAAIISGILGGLIGAGGPPNVIWTHAHRWSNETYRVTPVALALPRVPVQVGLMLSVFGRSLLPVFVSGTLFVPFSILGAGLGLLVGSRLPIAWLRMAVFLLLGLFGVANVFRPYFGF